MTDARMPNIHLAQINIGRMKAPLDDPAMAGFMSRLDDLNALADRSRGFVWRLQGDAGNNTYLRPYVSDRSPRSRSGSDRGAQSALLSSDC